MSRHLCLKWNNHSSAFLKTVNRISFKEKYCDATIVCQERYFPVHRIVLSTCSNYFDDLFERLQCQHPYIIFKDIEPKQMELLLNYMYQGEVNVVQDSLSSLIKAAEALRIKGLVVPDDWSSNKEISGKKRSCPVSDSTEPKRKQEDSRSNIHKLNKHSENTETKEEKDSPTTESENCVNNDKRLPLRNDESTIIKEEPLDPLQFEKVSIPDDSGAASKCDSDSTEENVCKDIPNTEDSFVKAQAHPGAFEDPYREQSASMWDNFSDMNAERDTVPIEMNKQAVVGEIEPVVVGVDDIATSSTKAFSRDQHPGQCPHCDYENYSNLARHIRAKHPEQKPHQCLICTSRFLTRRALERHMVIHTGRDPFKCPLCYVEFYRFCSLNTHLETCFFGRYSS